MTEESGRDDDDERETLAGDKSVPRDEDTAQDFDLESLPGKRPLPRKPPAPTPLPPSASPRRKLPEADDVFDAPPETAPADFAPPPSEAAPKTVEPPPSTETPTREIDVERELPTIVGEFAGTTSDGASKAPPDSDEAETVVEQRPPEATGPQLAKGTQGTDATGRTAGRPWKSPLPKGPSRTARDPIAGTAASRLSTPGGRSAPTVLAEGQLLADRYELVERLGKGGMGEVWKAKHILLQGMRAIKVIKASISKDATFRQRFLKEGQTMMRVKHPGVVEVTDLDETRQNRELFMVMEYLKGRTIYDAIRSKDKPLAADVRDAVRVLREVALGMQRNHDERIVHKDLKTDNVLLVVGDDGLEHPKVIDFGLAKSLGAEDAAPGEGTVPEPAGSSSPQHYDPDLHTTLSGTLAYMAPEQFRSEPSSFQSDIYAFGVMAYETFAAGEFPLPRGPLSHYIDLHKRDTKPDVLATKRPDLDPRLTAIFDRCLAMNRTDRPASFTEVAADLQFWLDTPERLARRKKQVYTTTGALLLAAAAVWGVFFSGETSASLSNLKVTAPGVAFTFDGTTAHVPAAALPALVLTADIKGKPGEPVLEVDGQRRDVKSELRDGQLIATANLHDVPDGPHSLSLHASASAAPANLTLDVDRVPPTVGAITVTGAVVTKDGVFSNSESPEVVVDVQEPANHISSVVAVNAGGARSPGERDGATDRWVIKGTSVGDGKADFEVTVRDLAGNETKKRVAYVRDVKGPLVEFGDLFKSLTDGATPSVLGLWVREPDGSKMRVSVDEPSDVSVTFGTAPAVTRHLAEAGVAEIEVPHVPDDGFATKVVVRDVAGNEAVREFPLGVIPDYIRVMNINAQQNLAVKGDGSAENPSLIVLRTYPLGDGFQLWSEQLRAADGTETPGSPRTALRLPQINATNEGKLVVFTMPPHALPEGVYRITATVSDTVPSVMPLSLTVDATPPTVESVAVADATGRRPVAEGAYSRHADVVVTAVVSDLELRRIDLDKAGPAEKTVPGRGTYTFEVRLPHEGLTSMTLSLADAAGNHVERTVNVLGDWTDPEIVRLDSPRDGESFTDVKPVDFRGLCSESPYKLVVEGLPGTSPSANCDTAEFAQKFNLPATEGPVALDVYAIDPAGRRSAARTVHITVVHKTTDLPDEVTWKDGVNATMEKVVAGDVVIGGRVRPVALSFVDRTETTNRDYRTFLAATKGAHGAWCHADEPKGWDHTPAAETWKNARWNADDLPVVNVAWWDAFAFAKWSGRRLASEAEWVKAAAKGKGAGETELRSWPPFGPRDEWRNGVVVTSDWSKGPASALSGGDVSPVGCLHMGGNVSEWVDLPEPVDGSPSGTRGGSWFFSRRAADVRNTPAKAWPRSFRADTIGFRCAVDAGQVQP